MGKFDPSKSTTIDRQNFLSVHWKLPIFWRLSIYSPYSRFSACLILIFFAIFITAQTVFAADVQVSFEWESVTGAKLYQVEMKELKSGKIYDYKNVDPQFNMKLPIGKYKVRGRAADYRKVFGEWSDWTDFLVTPSTPVAKQSTPENFTMSPDRKSLLAEKLFSWTASQGAALYLLEIKDASGKVIAKKTTTKTDAKLRLKPGQYSVQLTALASDGTPSESLILAKDLHVNSMKLAQPKISAKANGESPEIKAENPNAVRLKIEYQAHLAGEQWNQVFQGSQKEYELFAQQKRTPGRYRFTVWLESAGWEKSDSSTLDYVIKPSEKDLE